MYPEFQVPGISPDDIWQLFNVSNYAYYCKKVDSLLQGVCGFCQIDPELNKTLYENDAWRVWKNNLAAQEGQDYQFVIPSKRHLGNIDEVNYKEWFLLAEATRWINREFSIDGGVLLVRSGNPLRNAKSMPHLHFNYHVPTGRDRVTVTIAKSSKNLVEKLPILQVFEKMRQGMSFEELSEEERSLVEDKMTPKGAC